MSKVFISHSSKDAKFVEEELLPLFEQHGIDSWYSPTDIMTAIEWERSIRDGLKTCDWFLVLLSQNSVKSDWVQTEVHWAVQNRRNRIIPVLLDSCDPDELHLRLSRVQHVDYRHDRVSARAKLSAIWQSDANLLPSQVNRSVSGPANLDKAAAFLLGWFAKKVLLPEVPFKEPFYSMIDTYLNRFSIKLSKSTAWYLSDPYQDGSSRAQQFTQSAFDALNSKRGKTTAIHFAVASNLMLTVLPCQYGPAMPNVKAQVERLVKHLDLPELLQEVPDSDLLPYCNRLAKYYEEVE